MKRLAITAEPLKRWPLVRRMQRGRIAAFAQRLAGRYTRGRAARRGIDLLLANAHRTFVQYLVHRHRTLLQRAHTVITSRSLRASIDLRLRQAHPALTRGATFENDRGSEAALIVHSPQYGLLHRIVERTRRIEVTAKHTFTSSVVRNGHGFDIARAPVGEAALPLASARSAPAAAATSRDGPPPLVQDTHNEVPARPAFVQRDDHPVARRDLSCAAPLPEHDIERLAERVIGSIDRRIAAQRERMGRA